MMGSTHRAYAFTFTTGIAFAVNAVTAVAHDKYAITIPAIVIAGLSSMYFSSGKFSPDIDRTWAPGPPRRGYHWRGHRGWTHRVWFASFLSVVWLALAAQVLSVHPVLMSADVWYVWSAPLLGWWSHLSGDMIYGRLPVMGQPIGLGIPTTPAGADRATWLVRVAGFLLLGACFGLQFF